MNRHATTALVCVAAVAWLYSDALSSLVRQWASDDNYSHGFFVIPLAVYFAWERRQQLASAEPRPHLAGLAIVIASLAVFAAGVLSVELFLTRISLVGVVVGTIMFVWGPAYVRYLAFPLALLPLMVPLPEIVFNQIAFPLQLVASRFGEEALIAAGIPVLREGNVLELPNITLAVAEACSGIRSLITLITLAVVQAYFAESRPLARVVIVASAVPIAIFANACRVAGTGVASHWYGPAAATGFFHGFSGWFVFGVACVGLLIVQGIVRRIPRSPSAPPRQRLTVEHECSPAQ